MPVLRGGVSKGRAAENQQNFEADEGIATRTRRRRAAAAAAAVAQPKKNTRQAKGAAAENLATAVAEEEGQHNRLLEVGLRTAGGGGGGGGEEKEEVGEKPMDEFNSRGRSAGKAHAAEEEGSTAPLPEKVYLRISFLCEIIQGFCLQQSAGGYPFLIAMNVILDTVSSAYGQCRLLLLNDRLLG